MPLAYTSATSREYQGLWSAISNKVLSPVAPAITNQKRRRELYGGSTYILDCDSRPFPTTIESHPQNDASSPILLVPLVKKLSTTAAAEFPPPATVKALEELGTPNVSNFFRSAWKLL
jgi:hypothetical protein